MKFLITPYNNPDDDRIIEAAGFSVDETGHIVLKDGKGEMVARLLNVNVEPLPTGKKQSSAKLAKLAGRYLNFDLLDRMSGPMSPEDVNAISDDIQSLAASVLSQKEPKDAPEER